MFILTPLSKYMRMENRQENIIEHWKELSMQEDGITPMTLMIGLILKSNMHRQTKT